MGNIKKRQEAIKTIISSRTIEDQHALMECMQNEFHIATSQAIISRDLQALGISKRKIGNQMVYELPKVDPVIEILRHSVITVTHNETTIVITTVAGCADFVGDYLDIYAKSEILGTVAGENTIIVIPASIKKIGQVATMLKRILHVKESTNEQ